MSTANTITASPAKLRSGDWGAKVKGSVSEGDTITIVTRAGKRWEAIVEKIVWKGDGVSICATRKVSRSDGGSRKAKHFCGRCRDCGGPIVDAPHCQAMEGYCGSCAYDEF